MADHDTAAVDVKIDLDDDVRKGQSASKVDNVQLDMLNRDPNDINPHLKVTDGATFTFHATCIFQAKSDVETAGVAMGLLGHLLVQQGPI